MPYGNRASKGTPMAVLCCVIWPFRHPRRRYLDCGLMTSYALAAVKPTIKRRNGKSAVELRLLHMLGCSGAQQEAWLCGREASIISHQFTNTTYHITLAGSSVAVSRFIKAVARRVSHNTSLTPTSSPRRLQPPCPSSTTHGTSSTLSTNTAYLRVL